jgi:hypothetical protein
MKNSKIKIGVMVGLMGLAGSLVWRELGKTDGRTSAAEKIVSGTSSSPGHLNSVSPTEGKAGIQGLPDAAAATLRSFGPAATPGTASDPLPHAALVRSSSATVAASAADPVSPSLAVSDVPARAPGSFDYSPGDGPGTPAASLPRWQEYASLRTPEMMSADSEYAKALFADLAAKRRLRLTLEAQQATH